jgi:hypothetical protein
MISRKKFFLRVLLRFSWLPVLAVFLFLLSGNVRSASILSWDDYWKLVDETDQLISLAEQSPIQAPELLNDISDQWKTVTNVRLPNSDTQIVNPGVLIVQLEGLDPDWKGLHDLLAQMKASRPRESLATFNEQDAQAVQSILGRSEYNWPDDLQQNFIQRFFANLLDKIIDFLHQLIPQSQVAVNIDPRPFFILGIFLILLLVLYFSFRGAILDLVQEAGLKIGNRGEEALTATQAMQRAQGLAENGDNRLAVRYLYLSALLQLEERGLLRYDRSRTNREYLRSIQGRPQLALMLQAVVEVFDRVWYGYQSIDNERFSQYLEQVNRLKDLK